MARRIRNKPDKVIADVNHVGPYFLLRFIMEKLFCIPINLWIGFDLVSAFKRLPIAPASGEETPIEGDGRSSFLPPSPIARRFRHHRSYAPDQCEVVHTPGSHHGIEKEPCG